MVTGVLITHGFVQIENSDHAAFLGEAQGGGAADAAGAAGQDHSFAIQSAHCVNPGQDGVRRIQADPDPRRFRYR